MALYNSSLDIPIPSISPTEGLITHSNSFNTSSVSESRVRVNNIRFRAKSGYYYSKIPVANLNFPGGENYIVSVISEQRDLNGYIIEVEFEIKYINSGFDVQQGDGHEVLFANEVFKKIDKSTEVKEIKNLSVDTSSIDANGESRVISIAGTPGSIFSLTIKDKHGVNVLPYSSQVSKSIVTVSGTGTTAAASNILELNNADDLEVGMVVLNNQRRNVKVTSITDTVKSNVDAVNETSSINVTISSHLTFSAGSTVNFAKEGDLTEITIPNSGSYSFTQNFPPLDKFVRTLKTEAVDSAVLTLDYTKDLEDNMKITGSGVDGNDPIIPSSGVSPDGVTIRVSDTQSIDDETQLTFGAPDNRYDITLRPINALIGDDIPKYSSDDCDILPAYSIYQYIDPIIQFAPSSDISNVTVDGTITLTGKANRNVIGTNGDITINMTATKSDDNLAVSRAPRFSEIDPDLSDFSNTLNTFTKTVREGDKHCRDTDIVHLNNTTGIRAGMIVTGSGIDTNKTITVKSITGTAVKLSEKQTINKGDSLLFNSMFTISIRNLTATLSANGGLATGICTVTGEGSIETFGIDSFTSTFDFDNFLSISG